MKNFFTDCVDKKSPSRTSRFVGIQRESGKIINSEDAFYYALWRVLSNDEEMEEFVEWYYSGNWIFEDYDEEDF